MGAVVGGPLAADDAHRHEDLGARAFCCFDRQIVLLQAAAPDVVFQRDVV